MNTCGWIDGVGYELIRQAIDATRATVILVLDNERLYSDLQQDLSQVQDRRIRIHARPSPHPLYGGVSCALNSTMPRFYFVWAEVIKLYKSGGVVTRDPNFRRQVLRSLCRASCVVSCACRVVCAVRVGCAR